MADAQLKIRIGADIGAAVSGVGKLNNVLRETASAADLAGLKFAGITGRAPLGDINSFRNAVNKLKTDIGSGFVPVIQRVPGTLNQIPPALNKVSVSSRQASNFLLNVGRTTQDAAYGFGAIANNIGELPNLYRSVVLEAKRLSEETGKNVTALQLLGKSLTGAAGIGFALNIVTTAITLATVGFGAWTRGLGGASEAQKKAAEEAKRLKELIKDVGDITAEAQGSVSGQVASVQALASAVSDTNKSYEERENALKQLQKINKEYFGDLTLEQAQLTKLTTAVNDYTAAIIQQAITKELEGEIGKVGAELAKQRKRFNEAEQALNDYKKSLDIKPIDEAGNRVFVLDNNITDLTENRKKELKALQPLTDQYNKLNEALKESVSLSLNQKSLTGDGGKEEDALKVRLAALEKLKEATQDINQLVGIEEQIFDLKVRITLRDAAKEGLSKSETDLLIDSYRRQLEDVFLQQALSLEASPRVQVQNINIVPIPAKEVESAIAKAIGVDKKISALTISDLNIIIKGSAVRAEIQEKEAIIKSLQDQIKTIINQGLVDSFAGIGESIGQILAGGGVGNIAKSFLLVVANAVQSIGKAAISAGVAMLGLKKALTAILANPAGLILAGSALVALGAGLKASIENSVPKFAQGGIATGPTLGIFGEKGTEAVIPLDRLPQLIRQAGSNGTVTVNGRLTMDSRQLVANLSRAQTNFDRIN